jgi:hypothetical protein
VGYLTVAYAKLLCVQIDKATLDKASAAALGESRSSSSDSSSSDSDSGSAGDSTKPRKSVGDLSDAELKGKKVKLPVAVTAVTDTVIAASVSACLHSLKFSLLVDAAGCH